MTATPLFVSLGSVCEPNHMLRFCEMKDASYPFDWIVSMDGEKLLEILHDDFRHFLDEDYLTVYDIGGGPLLNTYYHLEFLHEGDWRGEEFGPNMRVFQPKYRRRIERFRALGQHDGPIYFLRAAYPHSLTDPHRCYRIRENLEITDDYSRRLADALGECFPRSDLRLVVINSHDRGEIEDEGLLSDRILKVRVNPGLDVPVKVAQHRKFLLELLEGSTFPP